MAIVPITIHQILGGWSPSENFGSPGQFIASLGVDPELPKNDSDKTISGLIRPTAMAKFSATTVTGAPMWIIPNPVDADKNFVYATDGKIHLITSALAMGTDVATLATAGGNGAAYYKNFGYFARNTDIARYRADGAVAIDTSFWVTTLAKTALANKAYPSIRGVAIPNHAMHVHPSNSRLYVCDVDSDDKGCLHMINTKKGTVEGDTNDTTTPSAYKAISFGYKEYPVALDSLGTQLVIGCINSVNASVMNSRAFSIIIWDTTSSTYQSVAHHYADPLVTAVKNVNGVIYVFSGTANGGCRISYLSSSHSLKQIAYIPNAAPPFAGATDSCFERVIFGGFTTIPEDTGCLFALGSKESRMGLGVHNIYKANVDAGSNPIVTCAKYLELTSHKGIQPVIGWKTGTAQGLDKTSTTYGTWYLWSERFRIGQEFTIKKIVIPLAQAVAANMTITPKIYTDQGLVSTALRAINNTNFSGLKQAVFNDPVKGNNDFYLELKGTGTVLLTVSVPIRILVDVHGQ